MVITLPWVLPMKLSQIFQLPINTPFMLTNVALNSYTLCIVPEFECRSLNGWLFKLRHSFKLRHCQILSRSDNWTLPKIIGIFFSKCLIKLKHFVRLFERKNTKWLKAVIRMKTKYVTCCVFASLYWSKSSFSVF